MSIHQGYENISFLHTKIYEDSISISNCNNLPDNLEQNKYDETLFQDKNHPDSSLGSTVGQTSVNCSPCGQIPPHHQSTGPDFSSESNLIDSAEHSSTPLSWVEDSNGAQFKDSSWSFYSVSCAMDETVRNVTVLSVENFFLDHSINFMQFKNSRETASLAEECFQTKITPLFLLTILYGRKKHDQLAKDFIKQMPSQLVDKIKKSADIPDNECMGS